MLVRWYGTSVAIVGFKWFYSTADSAAAAEVWGRLIGVLSVMLDSYKVMFSSFNDENLILLKFDLIELTM